MPALTPANVFELERIARLSSTSRVSRPVKTITEAPRGYEGLGFPVRRAFAGVALVDLDPFIHMDEMGEVEYEPGEAKGTPWHPHRGFETVTYMIDGIFQHRDSMGGGGLITNGDTQWMTAGSGLLHIEEPPVESVQRGGLFHGLQLWVNLPSRAKMSDPRYQDIRAKQVKIVASPDGGAILRIIAGTLGEFTGPGATHTPITMVHATVAPGAQLQVPWPAPFNALAYVIGGNGTVGPNSVPISAGHLAIFETGDFLTVAADQTQISQTPELDILLLGGQPIREPIAAYGPFVMNTRAEIRQAFEDYEAGRLGVPTTT